jgi:Holliday junction resolvase RusA-like endonuclease
VSTTTPVTKGLTVTIRLPGVPRGKQRPRLGKHGVYTPEQTVKYEASLAWVAKQAMRGYAPYTGPLRVLIVSGFPIPKSYNKTKTLDAKIGAIHPTKKPDIDNIVKLVDALNGIVWRDDAQIVHCDVRKVYSAEPELAIQVTPL